MICTGPADYTFNEDYVTLYATTSSSTMTQLRITLVDDDVLERDDVLNVMLRSMERRVEVSNSTTVVILNDDGECARVYRSITELYKLKY